MTTTVRIATLSLIFLLASCGWHLRGTEPGLRELQSVHITAEQINYKMVETLARKFRASEVTVTKNATEAQYRLVLQNEQSDRRVATLSGSARVSEYRLTEQIDLTILNAAGDVVLPKTTLETERVYEFDEDNVHAMSDEQQLIKSEMRETLARQIIYRLQVASKSETPAANAP